MSTENAQDIFLKCPPLIINVFEARDTAETDKQKIMALEKILEAMGFGITLSDVTHQRFEVKDGQPMITLTFSLFLVLLYDRKTVLSADIQVSVRDKRKT
jgi:hypothetical protein